MNNITVTISAPELVEAMQALTLALQAGTIKPAEVEQVIEKLEFEAIPKIVKADKPVKVKGKLTNVAVAGIPDDTGVAELAIPDDTSVAFSEPATKVTATNITLDDVRIALGNLSQAGKQAEVKQLIASFGATKLSEISTDRYAELMAEAEALNG